MTTADTERSKFRKYGENTFKNYLEHQINSTRYEFMLI